MNDFIKKHDILKWCRFELYTLEKYFVMYLVQLLQMMKLHFNERLEKWLEPMHFLLSYSKAFNEWSMHWKIIQWRLFEWLWQKDFLWWTLVWINNSLEPLRLQSFDDDDLFLWVSCAKIQEDFSNVKRKGRTRGNYDKQRIK